MMAGLFLTQLGEAVKPAVWQEGLTRKRWWLYPKSQRSSDITQRILVGSLPKGRSLLGGSEILGSRPSKKLKNISARILLQVAHDESKHDLSTNKIIAVELVKRTTYYLKRNEGVVAHSPIAKSTRNSWTEARDLLTILQKLCSGSSQGTGCGVYLAFFSVLLCRRAGIAWRYTHE